MNHMNKILNISVVLMLLVSIIPLAYANDSEKSLNDSFIDENTQQEIEVMKYHLGSEIRLLQLEKAIIKNIAKGERIINLTEENGINTSSLELIIEELYLLKQEVQSADPNASDAVRIFVDLKHDAVNLTKDFRDTLQGVLNTTSLERLQIRIQNMSCNQTRNISNFIQNKIRQYNTNQFRRFYQFLGENESYCLNQYRNGSLSINQMRENITKKINQNEKARQFNLLTSLKKEKIQSKIKAQHQVQNVSERFEERVQNRLEKRLQRLENHSENGLQQGLINRIQNKINNLDITGNSNNQNGKGNENPYVGNDQSDMGNNESGQGNEGSGIEPGYNGSGKKGTGGSQ